MTQTAQTQISFQQRNGLKVTGEVIEQIGINLLIKVAFASRKSARNRTSLFPINDMADAKTSSAALRDFISKGRLNHRNGECST